MSNPQPSDMATPVERLPPAFVARGNIPARSRTDTEHPPWLSERWGGLLQSARMRALRLPCCIDCATVSASDIPCPPRLARSCAAVGGRGHGSGANYPRG